MSHKALVLAVWLAAFSVAADAKPAAPLVMIDSGKIAGNEKDGMMSFLGIPYAAPPTGDLRWRAPQPVKAWRDTRQTTEFGPVCRQTADWVKMPQSEDCLTLNVWAPATKSDKPYPVLVWIHGGGMMSGHGSEWGPDGGESLVRKDLILVSINYRLGLFGFLAHPELSADANQGLRDQIAALQWVKRNVAAFGGDPDNVTIAGNSAGGSSVTVLTVSPLAKGLFHRGIAESGAIGQLPPREAAEKQGADLSETLKAPKLGDLRKVSAEELLKQKWQPMPHVDGAVFTEQPDQSFSAGRQNKVPLLLGWNADEGLDLAPDVFGTKDITGAIYESQLQKMFGPPIREVVQTRYPGKTDMEAMSSARRLVTDLVGLEHFRWATMQQKTNTQPVYLYYYVHSPAEPPADNPCYYGCKAGHTAEIRFAYGQLGREQRAWSKDDLALQEQMFGYWTSFAKTGDPNGEARTIWPVFDGTPDTVQRLGSPAEIKERGNFPDFRPYLAMPQQ